VGSLDIHDVALTNELSQLSADLSAERAAVIVVDDNIEDIGLCKSALMDDFDIYGCLSARHMFDVLLQDAPVV